MPTLARPDVDLLDGLTTAIIVDQERMGANVRSTVGTATDANALLRLLFSRLGQAAHRSAHGLLVQRPHAQGQRRDDRRQGQGRADRRPRRDLLRRHVPALRGHGLGQRHGPDPALRRHEVAERGCAQGPRLQHGRLVGPDLRGRRLRHGQADPRLHAEGARRPAPQGADQDQGRGSQPDLRGAHPADPEVDALQGRRHPPAARPRLRRAGGDVHALPRVRRHAAQRAGSLVADRRDQHRRGLRDADRRPRRVAARPGRAVGRPAPRRPPARVRLVRRDRARLSLARPAVGHAVGRGVAADQDDPPPRLVPDRRHLRLRRAHDRAASARHRPDERPAAAPAGQGQHGPRRRAQARGHRHRRPRHRPRPGGRDGRRRGGLRGHGRGPARPARP